MASSVKLTKHLSFTPSNSKQFGFRSESNIYRCPGCCCSAKKRKIIAWKIRGFCLQKVKKEKKEKLDKCYSLSTILIPLLMCYCVSSGRKRSVTHMYVIGTRSYHNLRLSSGLSGFELCKIRLFGRSGVLSECYCNMGSLTAWANQGMLRRSRTDVCILRVYRVWQP